MAPASDEVAEQIGPMDQQLRAGDKVGEYVVEAVLGTGGFGTVYRARHPLIGKQAAVKVLARQFSSDPEMVSRFVSEARVVNTIGHANIIDVFSFGTLEDDRRYFVMELLSGLPLDEYLRQAGPLDPPQVVAIMRGVARALDAAHEKGVVHRDLKPGNIFLSFDEENQPTAKLLDFGIAKLRGEAAAPAGHKTHTGVPIGTPHYMSPEQCRGADVDGRTDVYAFGVVCFEALTGTAPFDADSNLELMTQHTQAERPAASERRPELGTACDEALRTIMARQKEARPASVVEALSLLADAAGIALPAGASTPAAPFVRPAEVRALGEAQTLRADESAAGQAPASARRRAISITAITVVAAVALYLATSVLPGSPPDDGGASAAQVTLPPEKAPGEAAKQAPKTTPATGLVPPTAAKAPAPEPPRPSAGVEREPSQQARFELVLHSNAEGAVAFEGDDEIGALPGPLQLSGKRGERRTLTIKAKGFRTKQLDVILQPQLEQSVTLKPVRKKRINSDLEDPGF